MDSIHIEAESLEHTFGGIRTVTKRLFICHYAKLLSQIHLKGNIVEIGTARGDCVKLISENIDESYKIHVFDTFYGLPKQTLEDDLKNNCIEGFYNFSLDSVKNFIGNKKNIYYYKGLIEDTYKEFPNDIILCHIDCDLYSGVYTSLKYVIPKLKPGGCIIIDDYNNEYFKGVTKACKDIEKELDVKIYDLYEYNKEKINSRQAVFCKQI